MAFFCEDDIISQFSIFLFQLLTNDSRLAMVRSILSPSTFLFLVALAVLRGRHWNDFLIPLLTSDFTIHADAFRLIDMIGAAIASDLHTCQNHFMQKVLSVVLHHDFPRDKQPYFNYAIDFLCFRPAVTLGKKELKTDLHSLIALLKAPDFSIPESRYSLRMNDGRWEDLNLLRQLEAAVGRFPELKAQRFLIPFAFSLHPTMQLRTNTIAALEGLVSSIDDGLFWSSVVF
jgi:hypothetical protein